MSSTARSATSQTAMKRLAGALSFVCLVLFLLAIEQRHTVAAWEALRDDAVPAARRLVDRIAGLAAGAAQDGAEARPAVEAAPPMAATPGAAAVLGGEYRPADSAAREAAGALTVTGARLRLENGDAMRTRPLRIAAGRDAYAPGQTFAARLNAPQDAQIELREVIPESGAGASPPVKLCEGQAAGVVALLHRRQRVDMMLFRAGPRGSGTPLGEPCGAWTFAAR